MSKFTLGPRLSHRPRPYPLQSDFNIHHSFSDSKLEYLDHFNIDAFMAAGIYTAFYVWDSWYLHNTLPVGKLM